MVETRRDVTMGWHSACAGSAHVCQHKHFSHGEVKAILWLLVKSALRYTVAA